MSLLDSVEFPSSNNVDVRIAWAGERVMDLAEGLLSIEQGQLISQLLVGWTDLGTPNENRQYRQMASLIDELLRNR